MRIRNISIFLIMFVTIPVTVGNVYIWDEELGSPLPFTWNYTNFDGFNIGGIGTENLAIIQTDLGHAIGKTRIIKDKNSASGSGLSYNSTKRMVEYEVYKNKGLPIDYKESGRYYTIINIFGEPYIAIKDKARKLTKLILEQKVDEQKMLTSGETWNMGDGFTLSLMGLDSKATPRQAWLTLSKDGTKLNDLIVAEGITYTYIEKNFSGETDVPIFVTYVDNIFAGTNTNFIILRYSWLISKNITELRSGDIFGIFEITTASDNEIIFNNIYNISLDPGTIIGLDGNIKFKVVDNPAYLKFYPVIDRLNISSSYTRIPAGVPTNVIFTVTDNNLPINGASVNLKGAAIGKGITDSNGQVTINVNASYEGLIIVEAGKSSYANNTITIQSYLSPSTPIKTWNLQEDYILNLIDIDIGIYSRQALLQLIKNDIVVKNGIVHSGDTFKYCPSYHNCTFNATIDTIFNGSQGYIVEIKNVSQYAENGTQLSVDTTLLYKSTNFTGIGWQLDDGYELRIMDIDPMSDLISSIPLLPRLSYFELLKHNKTIDDIIIPTNFTYLYNDTNSKILEFKVDIIFNGLQGYLVKITNMSQYAENGTILRNNNSHLYKSTNFTDIRWYLHEGYEIRMIDIDIFSGPYSSVWLELLKNKTVVDDAIIYWRQKYYYNSSDIAISAKVDTIFKGETSSIVKLTDVDQYSRLSGYIINNATHSFISGIIKRVDKPLYENYILSIIGTGSGSVDNPNYDRCFINCSYGGDSGGSGGGSGGGSSRSYRERMLWLRLYKNDMIVDEKVTVTYDWWYYNVSNKTILYAKVYSIFREHGHTGHTVYLSNVTQYSELNDDILINNKTYKFFMDDAVITTPPIIITVISPTNNGVNNVDNVNITVTLDRIGIAILNWEGSNESMYGEETNYYKEKIGLLSGNYTFKIYARENGTNNLYNVSEIRTLIVNLSNTINLSNFIGADGNLSKQVDILSPTKNVTITIFNNTNMTINGNILDYINIDSPKSERLPNLPRDDRFIGENLILGPENARFVPDIQIKFNYINAQLSGVLESNIAIKFYNRLTNSWETLPTYEHNMSNNYITTNANHLGIFSLIGKVIRDDRRGNDGGSSSSSGGGGGASGENYTNIEIRERYDLYIFKDRTTSYIFAHKNNPILFINITGNVNAGEISTTVEVLKNTSSLVKTSAPGIVYKNINIWVGTSGFATPKNINNTTIRFKVGNQWILDNNVNNSDIKMAIWNNTEWTILKTKKIEKDSINTYFETNTSTFSNFAIIGLKIPKTIPITTVNKTKIIETTNISVPVETKSPGFETIFLVIIVLMVYIIRNRIE